MALHGTRAHRRMRKAQRRRLTTEGAVRPENIEEVHRKMKVQRAKEGLPARAPLTKKSPLLSEARIKLRLGRMFRRF